MKELPRLLLIGDRFTDPYVADGIASAVEAGVRWVQFRDHLASEKRFLVEARRLANRLRAQSPDVLLSINSFQVVAESLNAGLHIRSTEDPPTEYSGFPIGKSVHSLSEIGTFKGEYVLFSPIYVSPSKPGQRGRGLAALNIVCRSEFMPVIAMGGMTPERVRPCRHAGAYGIAVLSGILEARDIDERVGEYLTALERTT